MGGHDALREEGEMIEGVQVQPLEIKRDERGWLAEILQVSRKESDQPIRQLHLTVADPGKTRGKHYHRRKTEWACVVSGEGRLYLKDTRTGGEATVFMGESHMVKVCIPPYVAHAITNTGKEPLYLIVMAGEEFDPADPDTNPFHFASL
ncbi:MAG: cupin domain-containing protein [Deltaproteobacteria bacterium]|nr:cupin domain-containing protein [Deltaproteobacteria bacterium]